MEGRNLFAASDTDAGGLSFVAIGDSFTEGLNDPTPGGGFRGWADRLEVSGTLAEPHAAVALASRATVSSRGAWVTARREDARWAKEYFLPWVNRRLHGTSSGDGVAPKRPDLRPVTT
jgi:hypothetical protein